LTSKIAIAIITPHINCSHHYCQTEFRG
jgi:hypothetical protein